MGELLVINGPLWPHALRTPLVYRNAIAIDWHDDLCGGWWAHGESPTIVDDDVDDLVSVITILTTVVLKHNSPAYWIRKRGAFARSQQTSLRCKTLNNFLWVR